MVAAAVLSLTLLAGACSGDEEAEETTTTAAAEDTNTTLAPVSDDEYAKQVEPFKASLEDAGTDPCALSASVGSLPEVTPSTPEQIKMALELPVLLFRAIAATDEADGQYGPAFAAAASRLEAAAAEAEYDPGFFESPEYAEALSTPETQAAYGAFSQRVAEECDLPETGPGEAPTLDEPAETPADEPAEDGDGER